MANLFDKSNKGISKFLQDVSEASGLKEDKKEEKPKRKKFKKVKRFLNKKTNKNLEDAKRKGNLGDVIQKFTEDMQK